MVASKSTIFVALLAVEVTAFSDMVWLGDTDLWGGDLSSQGNTDDWAAFNLCKQLNGCSAFVRSGGRTYYKHLPSTSPPSHSPGHVAHLMADGNLQSKGSGRWWKWVRCVDWPGHDRYHWRCNGWSDQDKILKAEQVHCDVIVEENGNCNGKVFSNLGKSTRGGCGYVRAYIMEHNPWSSSMIANNTILYS